MKLHQLRSCEPDLPPNAHLWCPCCGATYSATPGDYFNVDDNEEFLCSSCAEPLILAIRKVVFEPVHLTDESVITVHH